MSLIIFFLQSIWGGEYYLPLVETETKANNVTLKCEQIGDLSSLRWVEAPQPDANGKGIIVDVSSIITTLVNKFHIRSV